MGHGTRGAAWLLLVVLCACVPAPAGAHAGPPFAIVVDERVGPWLASVWTDPDIGIGEFLVVLEPAGDAPLPGSTQVRVDVQPVSGRLREAIYDAAPQSVRRSERHYTEVAFDPGRMVGGPHSCLALAFIWFRVALRRRSEPGRAAT